jgi:transcriptional regulator with XRE-family HTH domain
VKTVTSDPGVERRRAFGQALRDAIAIRKMTQDEVSSAIGITQSAISAWVNGKSAPGDIDTVYQVEQLLELPTGHLARLLGYLPEGEVAPAADFEAVVMGDPLLSDEQKRGFLAMYREFTAARRRRPPARRARRG